MILPTSFHSPVLLPQVIEGLNVREGKKYIDATIGGGGYTDEILKRGGVVLGIDLDQEAIEYLRKKYQISDIKNKLNKKIILTQGNFAHLKKLAIKFGFNQIAGIVIDLGFSSFQLETSKRGFSFKSSEQLDMRMDAHQSLTAADIINKYSREELYEIFTKFAEEIHSRTIVSAILSARSLNGYIGTTDKLVAIIDKVLMKIYANNSSYKFLKIRMNCLARCFQALRIEVNNELTNLRKVLPAAIDFLEQGGRLAILSYHSLEDRLVKLQFNKYMRKDQIVIITKKPIVATREETSANPKSHSVRLRIAQKL